MNNLLRISKKLKFNNLLKINNYRFYSDKYNKNLSDFVENQDKQFNEEEEFNDNKNSIYLYTLGGVTLTCLYLVYQMNLMKENNVKNKNKVLKNKGIPSIGGSWELINSENKPFGSEDLQGKYYMIYFGFCNCPDICPQTMKKISKAYDLIKTFPEKKYFDLEYIFVSVDPDRDDSIKLKKFSQNFNKDIISVTGKSNNDPLLKEMMKKFKIYASKIEIEDENGNSDSKNYYLDHTIITYLMSKDNTYLTHIGGSMNANDIANYVVDKVLEYEKEI